MIDIYYAADDETISQEKILIKKKFLQKGLHFVEKDDNMNLIKKAFVEIA